MEYVKHIEARVNQKQVLMKLAIKEEEEQAKEKHMQQQRSLQSGLQNWVARYSWLVLFSLPIGLHFFLIHMCFPLYLSGRFRSRS